jgi:aspartyl/asparaginyl beta-hydroxylase (cupin superfamily)
MSESLRLLIRNWLDELRASQSTAQLARIEAFASTAIGEAPAAAAPLQNPELYFWPGLEASPWPDRAPGWLSDLEAAYPIIRRELDVLLSAGVAFAPYAEGPEGSYRQQKFELEARSDRWSIYDLHQPDADARCPRTIQFLRTWFRAELGEPVTAQFSALRPGAHIPPHCGVSNVFLTAHLGLIVPKGCRIRVGAEMRRWQEARAFIFDDSFEHEAWNEGSSTRIVLIARFWHPALTELEIEALGTLHERVRAWVGESTAAQREALARLRLRGGA